MLWDYCHIGINLSGADSVTEISVEEISLVQTQTAQAWRDKGYTQLQGKEERQSATLKTSHVSSLDHFRGIGVNRKKETPND